MMHKAWSSIEEVPYCFSRLSVKFQGYTALKIVEFDPNWAFPDCNSQLEFINGYEMLHKAWNSKGEMPYCFPRSSIKFQGHTGQNITDFDPNWAFPDYRPVAAFKSLRFALFQSDFGAWCIPCEIAFGWLTRLHWCKHWFRLWLDAIRLQTITWVNVDPDLNSYMPSQWVKLVWPSYTIWQQRSGSTLAQVMACCLTAPRHYLNQCWLIISEVHWLSY